MHYIMSALNLAGFAVRLKKFALLKKPSDFGANEPLFQVQMHN
jgi:hypothetical protein